MGAAQGLQLSRITPLCSMLQIPLLAQGCGNVAVLLLDWCNIPLMYWVVNRLPVPVVLRGDGKDQKVHLYQLV